MAAVVSLLALLVAACGETRSQRPVASGDGERGRLLLAQYQCGRCHTIPGVAAADGKVAVGLEAFGARSYIAGRLPNEPGMLIAWIVDPPALVPGTAMPALGASPVDARDMAAYLGALR